jgi:ABC-type lipoprotein export system ATPase subunit
MLYYTYYGGGMVVNSDEQVKAFLSLFDGDIQAAHAALDAENKQFQQTSPTTKTPSAYMHNEAIISLQDVSKKYKTGKQTINALQSVSMSIHKGEFVAITGASGSGKSTLLQIIGCLDKPSQGSVIVNKKDTTKLNDSALSELRKKTVGFIFQSFYLQPYLKLADNIAVPAMFTKTKKHLIDEKVTSLLDQVDLYDRKNHYPKELSGGQIQRAAIARALVNTPDIILADEPTGNLDSSNSQAIIDLFKTIRDTLGTTIIVVTHDASIASQADRVIQLKDGAII